MALQILARPGRDNRARNIIARPLLAMSHAGFARQTQNGIRLMHAFDSPAGDIPSSRSTACRVGISLCRSPDRFR
jgi:hypothetical protein